jgi:hypothetical protein
MGNAADFTAVLGIKDNLGDAPSVIQINKCHSAMISVVCNPAVEHNLSANIAFSQFTAVMRTFQSHS